LAALLVAAAGNQSAAQSSAASGRMKAESETRSSTALPSGVAHPSSFILHPSALESSEGTSGSHHKSWKELVRSKSEGKADKPPVTLSPWSAAGALAVVVGLILVLARLFRRHAPMFQQTLPQEALEILGRRHVDPRQTILLVRIGSRILVIGSSANGLNSLGEIVDPVEVDVLAGMCRRDPQTGVLGTSFFKLLKRESLQRPTPAPISPAAFRSSPVRMSPGAQQSSAPDLREDGPSVMRPLESPPDGLSQPEYDLMRRLRGAPAPRHAATAEGVL